MVGNMKRSAIVIVLASSTALGIIAACGFPDVEFITGEGDSSAPDAPAADAPAADAPGDSAPVGANEDVDPNGSDADATTAPDSQRIDAGPDATCCDCDQDHVKSSGPCAEPPGDCDDTNPFVFKGQTFVDSTVWDTDHVPTYDWDCSGSVVKQYTYDLPACKGRLAAAGGCSAAQGGFLGDPACGVSGHYIISCIPDPATLNVNCKEAQFDTRKQGCH